MLPSFRAQNYLKENELPGIVQADIDTLQSLVAEHDSIACGLTAELIGDTVLNPIKSRTDVDSEGGVRFSAQLSISVASGGGAQVLMDAAETERIEARMILTSLTTRWKDAWSEIAAWRDGMDTLLNKWQHYNMEMGKLESWIEETRTQLANENLPSEDRIRLYAEMKHWRELLTDLAHVAEDIMGMADKEIAVDLEKQIAQMNQVYRNVSEEVSLLIAVWP
ncbi:unnamed protein product [Protopolystoma xenopodis]|uniref:Nesprin-1 spectrin repeats region domain-containing protein n=1 Tax=Protopolystoma xenopodis TaxID=117903 RepID=A0A448WKT8_9PLAT|nr:unnamed protein product [Protopolystoma xenopodis]